MAKNSGKDSVVIIDYGSGNLRSAAKAFERVIVDAGLGYDVVVSDKAEDVACASHVVLPGQGAFGDCMSGLKGIDGMVEAIEQRVIKQGQPFLGICVGMQLMVTRGLEYGEHAGLNWIEGEVVPMTPDDKALKIPHMGWNDILLPSLGEQDNAHFVLRSVESTEKSDAHYYFVHSFMVECKYSHHILATTQYGGSVAAVIGRDNMVGVQFHPEKSQENGLRLLSDFLHWKP